MNINVNHPDELNKAAEELLKFAGRQRIFLFFGEMGAGKTTFIKSICKALGFQDSVSSPTYSIVNEYPAKEALIYHFDFYRLKNEEEAYDIGFEEYLDSGNYCLIEWPERIESLWPENYIKVEIDETEDGSRQIKSTRI
ncbi:MAG: tRNA (adenosine(37)-N6)-threonylcarbamoyltransferase complex ATPase subunit type 1 TsaE [Daejeonella sp.]